MSQLPTDEIQSCLSMAQSPSSMNSIEFKQHITNAFDQLAALVDDNHKKAAKVIELQREIVDIHRHYGKEMGD